MNSAIAQFCLEIIAKHGDPAPRLCNKDPLTLKMGSYVIELFPNVSILLKIFLEFYTTLPHKRVNRLGFQVWTFSPIHQFQIGISWFAPLVFVVRKNVSFLKFIFLIYWKAIKRVFEKFKVLLEFNGLRFLFILIDFH